MVKDNIVTIFKGDDESLEVHFSNDYTMQDGDKLVLSVRQVPLDDSTVLLRVESYTDTLILTHDKTKLLDPGKYSYDVELLRRQPDGTYKHKTIIPKMDTVKPGSKANWKNFIVNGEVSSDESNELE